MAVKNYRLTMEIDVAVEVDDPDGEYEGWPSSLDFDVLDMATQSLSMDYDDGTDVCGVKMIALSDFDITRIDRVEDEANKVN